MVRVGQQVNVIVDRVYRFGVFGRSRDDGSQVYIRRRELTLSGDKNPLDITKPNATLNAIVLELPNEERILEASVRRALPDPWILFGRETKQGDIIWGTVKHLFSNRILVEIHPGVDGVITIDDLSNRIILKPEEVVWQGDHIQAVVMQIDPTRKYLKLSIRHLLQRLQYASDVLNQIVKASALKTLILSAQESTLPFVEQPVQINFSDDILVTDDTPEVRDSLVQWLTDEGCHAEGCKNGSEGLHKVRGHKYGLIIADLNMPEMNGIEFIKKIREEGFKIPVVIMTGPELVEKYGTELEALKISSVFVKPFEKDEIRQFLNEMVQGKVHHFIFEDHAYADTQSDVKPFRDTLDLMRMNSPLEERLDSALGYLISITAAEAAILFHSDPVSHLIKVKAKTGHLSINEGYVTGLIHSPVQDVILEEFEAIENRVSQQHAGAYRNIQKLIRFESCIGIPVYTAGRCEYALFIFHRNEEAFSRYRVRDVRASASLIAVAIENDMFNREVQNLGSVILAGQLTSAFNHEIYNKLTGLDLQMDHLRKVLHSAEVGKVSNLTESWDSINQIDSVVKELRQMVEDFRKITKGKRDHTININQFVELMYEKIRPIAEKAEVEIRPILDEKLPPASGNQFAIYYVFYNLTLNAIQHLYGRPGERLIKIVTNDNSQHISRCLQIRFMDNGPGIHRQLWDKIFEMGFTTREGGSGLGLFISRSLIEAYGGKISVEDSLVQLGTTFLVELPLEE